MKNIQSKIPLLISVIVIIGIIVAVVFALQVSFSPNAHQISDDSASTPPLTPAQNAAYTVENLTVHPEDSAQYLAGNDAWRNNFSQVVPTGMTLKADASTFKKVNEPSVLGTNFANRYTILTKATYTEGYTLKYVVNFDSKMEIISTSIPTGSGGEPQRLTPTQLFAVNTSVSSKDYATAVEVSKALSAWNTDPANLAPVKYYSPLASKIERSLKDGSYKNLGSKAYVEQQLSQISAAGLKKEYETNFAGSTLEAYPITWYSTGKNTGTITVQRVAKDGIFSSTFETYGMVRTDGTWEILKLND